MAATGPARLGSSDRGGLEPKHAPELGVICARLFEVLGPLHRLSGHDAQVLAISAGAMRPTDAARPLTDRDYRVIDGALDFAADALPHFWPAVTGRLPRADSRRALWIAAILRLAVALQWECGSVEDVYAAWTGDVLHIEVDSRRMPAGALGAVSSRVAALEFVAERRVLLTASAMRYGVLAH